MMLTLFRTLILLFFSIIMFIYGFLFSLISPRNPRNVYHISTHFHKISKLMGISIEFRFPPDVKHRKNHICISNHQSTWDMITVSGAIMPNVVTMGKKSLLWLPFFGFIFWITGNILIDRNNTDKARNTINQLVDKLKKKQISVWIFPEGTRSKQVGLLPFKKGAFHASVDSDLPIIPIVCSSTHGFKLNRWRNGSVIVEMLPPILPENYGKDKVNEYAEDCWQIMQQKLNDLNVEVAQRNEAEQIK